MKNLLLVCKLLVIAVLVVKIAILAGTMVGLEGFKKSLSVEEAIADDGRDQSSVQDSPPVDPLEQERELLKLLAQREQDLNQREEDLLREERRLVALKQEIGQRIDQHRALMESIELVDDQQYADLVKVYEATPPAQAGVMLERLDRKTAAAIIMRMRSRQAGEIWGHLDPDAAVAITGEITSMLSPGGEPEP